MRLRPKAKLSVNLNEHADWRARMFEVTSAVLLDFTLPLLTRAELPAIRSMTVLTVLRCPDASKFRYSKLALTCLTWCTTDGT